MGILAWIVVGLIAGFLASLVMGNRGNLLVTILVGIIGAIVGGFLAGLLFGVDDPINGINVGTIVIAFLGSIVAIALIRALPGRSPV